METYCVWPWIGIVILSKLVRHVEQTHDHSTDYAFNLFLNWCVFFSLKYVFIHWVLHCPSTGQFQFLYYYFFHDSLIIQICSALSMSTLSVFFLVSSFRINLHQSNCKLKKMVKFHSFKKKKKIYTGHQQNNKFDTQITLEGSINIILIIVKSRKNANEKTLMNYYKILTRSKHECSYIYARSHDKLSVCKWPNKKVAKRWLQQKYYLTLQTFLNLLSRRKIQYTKWNRFYYKLWFLIWLIKV